LADESNVQRVMAPEFNSSNNHLGPAREPGALWGLRWQGAVKRLKGWRRLGKQNPRRRLAGRGPMRRMDGGGLAEGSMLQTPALLSKDRCADLATTIKIGF